MNIQELLERPAAWLETVLSADPRWQAAGILLLSILLAKLTDWLVTGLLAAWARRSKTDLDDRLLRLLHRPVFVTVVLLGLGLALARLDLGDAPTPVVLRSLTTIGVFVWAAFLYRASALILGSLARLGGDKPLLDPRFVVIFDDAIKLLLGAGTLYFVLLVWGVDLGGLLVGAGVIGIALGLAAKDTLANLFSGLFILADAPYKVGDFVNLDSGERGEVTQIGLRSTRILSRDDIEIILPNAVIANAKIVNESGGPWVKQRVRVKVGVAYGSDVDQVERVLLEVAISHPDVATEPGPRVRFRAFGESSLDFELLGWIDEAVLRGRVLHALNGAVYKRFLAEGIKIPYPKRDVYLHRVASAED